MRLKTASVCLNKRMAALFFWMQFGDTSPAFQVKLLRVLQEGEIRPVGSSRSRKVDVRVLSATNRDLGEKVPEGALPRQSSIVRRKFSPRCQRLRERKMDIPLIAFDLLNSAAQSMDKDVAGFSPESLDCLTRYHWPGNVRELHNEILRALMSI